MKKILILSYHALPMDVVSSYRTKGFCEHLLALGIFPTLVTHRWEKDVNGQWRFHKENDEIVFQDEIGYKVVRLPRLRSQGRGIGFLSAVVNYFCGFFESELVESYRTYRQFLLRHLAKEKYDAIFTIYSPHFQMKLALEMKQKFGIPYIADFRDLWDNQIITRSYSPSIKKVIIDLIIRLWWTRWIRGSAFFTTTGTQWKDYLEGISGKKGFVVRNGYDQDIALKTMTGNQNKEFVIVHFGRLYSSQDLMVFLTGYKLFHNRKVGLKIKLHLIGHKPRYGVDIEKLLKDLQINSWQVTPYLSKEELFDYCQNSAAVFWMPGFIDDNGQFPVKIYDYFSLRKNIIYAPGDNSDAQRTIEKANTGVICNTPEEVCEQLLTWYSEYIVNGYLDYSGDEEVIQQYTRSNQVKILGEKINELIS